MNPKTLLTGLLCLLLPLLISAQDKNPFQSIGKKGKILTLTNGKYEEFFDQDSIQQIGTALVNIYTMKVIKLLKDEKEAQKLLDNSASSRFLSVDPLTVNYPWNSPYAFAENDVIRSVDLDGLERKIVNNFYFGNRLIRQNVFAVENKTSKELVDLQVLNEKGVRYTTKNVLVFNHRNNSIDFEAHDDLSSIPGATRTFNNPSIFPIDPAKDENGNPLPEPRGYEGEPTFPKGSTTAPVNRFTEQELESQTTFRNNTTVTPLASGQVPMYLGTTDILPGNIRNGTLVTEHPSFPSQLNNIQTQVNQIVNQQLRALPQGSVVVRRDVVVSVNLTLTFAVGTPQNVINNARATATQTFTNFLRGQGIRNVNVNVQGAAGNVTQPSSNANINLRVNIQTRTQDF